MSAPRQTARVGLVLRRREETIVVPNADVRLAATTVGVDVTTRFGRARLTHTGPRYVEVHRRDGRVEHARVADLDRAARLGVVDLGVVTTAVLRARRSTP